jgi:ABC-type branched-subunit amino acid transport system substrate-binding protein
VKGKLWTVLAVMVILSLGLAACGPTPTPEVVKEVVKETVVVEVEVEKEVVVTPTPEPEAPTPVPEPKTLYVGGTMALTGAYAEDTAAVLAAYEDYVKYVNETKMLAPWREEEFPADVTLEVLWRDDELKPEKALSIYEELKGKGILVFRGSGSPQVLALMDLLNEDRMGAVSMAVGPYLLSPPRTFLVQYPIYTDAVAAIADWFLENWKETRKPRVAYLTADNAMGKSVEIPELEAYLTEAGYEFVGSQYVPLVPTAPPTTQLLWLKENKVDLALGVMINPGAQPTVKEMVRLDMGPHLGYKITFGTASPGHAVVFAQAMGELGDGYVCAGSYPPLDDLTVQGIKFCDDLQAKYRPDKKVTHIMYAHGFVEAMIQVEALRLAMQEVPFEELKPVDVLEYGFYQIKDLDTGGITSTPLTFGPGDVVGMDSVRVQQVQGGKVVDLGNWPLHNIYKHE